MAPDEEQRTVTVSLDFLDPETTYVAHGWVDGEDAHYLGETRFSMDRWTRRLDPGNREMTLRMAPGGGFAVRIEPLQR